MDFEEEEIDQLLDQGLADSSNSRRSSNQPPKKIRKLNMAELQKRLKIDAQAQAKDQQQKGDDDNDEEEDGEINDNDEVENERENKNNLTSSTNEDNDQEVTGVGADFGGSDLSSNNSSSSSSASNSDSDSAEGDNDNSIDIAIDDGKRKSIVTISNTDTIEDDEDENEPGQDQNSDFSNNDNDNNPSDEDQDQDVNVIVDKNYEGLELELDIDEEEEESNEELDEESNDDEIIASASSNDEKMDNNNDVDDDDDDVKVKPVKVKNGKEKKSEYNEKEIIVLEEKGKNTFEVLPGGWLEVRHNSGMPIYLHRKTRVCSVSKPYFLGPGSARKHSIPLSGIPCLAYTRAIARELEEKVKEQNQTATNNSTIDEENEDPIENTNTTNSTCPIQMAERSEKNLIKNLPSVKVESVKENEKIFSVEPLELREYCKKIFHFKTVKSKRFKTWGARRRHTKEAKRQQLQRPTLPEGVQLITFPVKCQGGKGYKDYVMNPAGKTAVCILHEYVQHALRKQPTYQFKELENAATPYSATVIISGLQYGTGFGASKKQAKLESAKVAVEILIPDMKGHFDNSSTSSKKEKDDKDVDIATFFDQVEMDDVRITKMCSSISEPSPYALLLTCLQRNFGQTDSTHVIFEMVTSANQSNRFKMSAAGFSAEVQALNKREGKQLASQVLLTKIHPEIKNFSSFLRLYGNRSVKTVKEKKQEEQQITILQSKASANSPNYAILSKLKEEMLKLRARTSNLGGGLKNNSSGYSSTYYSSIARNYDENVSQNQNQEQKTLGTRAMYTGTTTTLLENGSTTNSTTGNNLADTSQSSQDQSSDID